MPWPFLRGPILTHTSLCLVGSVTIPEVLAVCCLITRPAISQRACFAHRSLLRRNVQQVWIQFTRCCAHRTYSRHEAWRSARIDTIRSQETAAAVGDRKEEAGPELQVTHGNAGPCSRGIAVGEIYLAMPNPDDNFVSDFQTTNFDSRLFELYLLAAFREQGVTVLQDHESTDFLIQRAGHECFVEAVTANPKETRIQGPTFPAFAPESQEERLLGAPALRFAKTLRSKIQWNYERLPHVQGKPFALAIADFQAPSSMVWSREALPSYLYGVHAKVEIGADGPHAVGSVVQKLLGPEGIPAGLFRDPAMSHLSAVIFSNAATLGKFNRMGFLAGRQPPGLKMIRFGIFFDPAPIAVKARDFEMDILSDEYSALWPRGEEWSQELEVYHNPLASNPLAFDLLPGAIDYFELDGDLVFRSIWENTILSSVTVTKFGAK